MKFLKGETKIFKIFNIVDIFIIVAVILVGAVAYTILGSAVSNQGSQKTGYEVVLEIKNVDITLCEAIKKDVKVYDKVQNVYIGTVLGSEYDKSFEYTTSTLNGEVKKSVIPDKYDIMLKLAIDTSEDVYVGKLMSIKTKDFVGSGYILNVNEIEE